MTDHKNDAAAYTALVNACKGAAFELTEAKGILGQVRDRCVSALDVAGECSRRPPVAPMSWQEMEDQPHSLTLLFKGEVDSDGMEKVWLGLAHHDDDGAVQWAYLPGESPLVSTCLGSTRPTGNPIADAVIMGFLHGVGREPWADMHDYIAVCAMDYASGKRVTPDVLKPTPLPSPSYQKKGS